MACSALLNIPTGAHGTVQIVYDFVSHAEERFLLEKVSHAGGDSPAPVSEEAGEGGAGPDGEQATAGPASKAGKSWGWKELNGRRSMYWGGTLLPSSGSLVPAPFPSFMDGQWPDVLGRIAETGVYDDRTGGKGKGKERGPNHVLVNEYLPGQGILPHTDGPAYLPCTTTLSLGSHTVLCLRSKPAHLTSSYASSDSSAAPPTENDPSAASTAEVEKIDLFLPPRSLLVLTGELYSSWLHGIQPLKTDSSEVLKGCKNWEGWWEWQASQSSSGEEGEEGETEEGRREEVMARKGLVEAGHGWERGKRVSLTCRRVEKVRKGLFQVGLRR
ncbi:hypothetical protein JCM8547_006956 [Rhodosporidiobolus lusitaniae]